MVDVPRLVALLDRVLHEVGAITTSLDRSDAALLASADALPALKYRLVIAIEAAIDAAAHVVAAERLRSPDTFADTFRSLEEAGWIDADLASRLGDAARFRNLLVHLYGDVDDARVLEIARTRLDALTRFQQTLAARAATG